MKKIICMLLALLLVLTGCHTSGSETTPTETTAAPTETTVPEMAVTVPTIPMNPVIGATEPGDSIAFANPGKARIAYTGMRSSVQYITSVEQLPDEEWFKDYDEEFFKTGALLVVVETVSSGSVQLEIESIRVSGDTASVQVKRTLSGDVGTTDMATWMLWVEVSNELDYDWVLPNSTNLPEGEKY